MTVIIKVGRRVPRSMRSRIVQKMKGLLSFQENIWVMLKMSFNMMRRKWLNKSLDSKGKIDLISIDYEKESEDIFHVIEWMTVTIQGDKEGEEDEHEGALGMYKSLGNQLKKVPKDAKDERLAAVFKTKLLDEEKLKKAYAEGYASEKKKSVQKILLEMGLLTHIEWIKDFDDRVPTPDIKG